MYLKNLALFKQGTRFRFAGERDNEREDLSLSPRTGRKYTAFILTCPLIHLGILGMCLRPVR